jgi:hypothetical protein
MCVAIKRTQCCRKTKLYPHVPQILQNSIINAYTFTIQYQLPRNTPHHPRETHRPPEIHHPRSRSRPSPYNSVDPPGIESGEKHRMMCDKNMPEA